MRLALLLLVGCAHGAGGDATFKVFYPDAPSSTGGFQASVGKKLQLKPVAQCVYGNGRDARWSMTGAKIASGELPDGFTIEDGAISGTPKRAGTWTVTVEFNGVTCAGVTKDPQRVDVTLVIK
jgi:hypothetical protein